MFTRTQMSAEISQMLIDELTEGGMRDLTDMRLDDMETEVYNAVDLITNRVMRGLAEDQAIQCNDTECPACGGELEDLTPLESTLTCDRGDITWKQPQKRCANKKCSHSRSSFFSSVESNGD